MVSDGLGRRKARQTAQQITQAGRAARGRMVGGEKAEHALAHRVVFFIDDGVAPAFDQHFGIDKSGERRDFAAEFEGVGHGQTVGMTRDWDQVLGTKNRRLLENFAAHFGQCEAIARGIEVIDAPGGLNGLERDAANAGLLQREIDNPAKFGVIASTLYGDDERGGNVEGIEAFKRLFTSAPKIGATKFQQGIALEGIELEIDLRVGRGLGKRNMKDSSCAMRMPLVFSIRWRRG